MEIGLDLLVCLVGFVVYAIAKEGKPLTVGLHMFWVGLLALLLQGNQIVALFHKN